MLKEIRVYGAEDGFGPQVLVELDRCACGGVVMQVSSRERADATGSPPMKLIRTEEVEDACSRSMSYRSGCSRIR